MNRFQGQGGDSGAETVPPCLPVTLSADRLFAALSVTQMWLQLNVVALLQTALSLDHERDKVERLMQRFVQVGQVSQKGIKDV